MTAVGVPTVRHCREKQSARHAGRKASEMQRNQLLAGADVFDAAVSVVSAAGATPLPAGAGAIDADAESLAVIDFASGFAPLSWSNGSCFGAAVAVPEREPPIDWT